MSLLSSEQVNKYNDEGYLAPIDVISSKQAFEIRNEIEHIEKKKTRTYK